MRNMQSLTPALTLRLSSDDLSQDVDSPHSGIYSSSSHLLRSLSKHGGSSTPMRNSDVPLTESMASSSIVKKYAYVFDGHGGFGARKWDLSRKESANSFSWYHIEVPRTCPNLSSGAMALIQNLYPTLSLQELTTLVSNGPFCGTIEKALILRINCTGPMDSPYTLRMAARVTENSMVSVALGRMPRLEFVRPSRSGGASKLDQVDESEEGVLLHHEGEDGNQLGINVELLEELLRRNHPQDADNLIPSTVPELLIHFVDTFVDQLQDMVVDAEVELEELERKMEKGDGSKRALLKKRTFPRMGLDLQKVLQTLAHSEVVVPKVKQKLLSRKWSAADELAALDGIMSRLKRSKENVGFLASRISALQASLDQWQAEQINRKLYYLSFLSMVFLPLSVVTGAFGMNVGGVPWVPQVTTDPYFLAGFVNVMWICVAIVLLMLVAFGVVPLFQRARRFSSALRGLGRGAWGRYLRERLGLKDAEPDDSSLIL